MHNTILRSPNMKNTTNQDNTQADTRKVCELKAGLIDKKRNLEQLIDRCTKCRERHQSFFGSEL